MNSSSGGSIHYYSFMENGHSYHCLLALYTNLLYYYYLSVRRTRKNPDNFATHLYNYKHFLFSVPQVRALHGT